jgi:hypothetical protein
MASGTTRRLGLSGLGFPSVVLLGNGIPMVIAAVVNIVFVHSLAAVGLGLVLASVGIGLIAAAIRLYAGSHGWWLASLGLLPVAAAFQFFDAYVLGDGRVPVVSGIIMPAAALTCLLLPPVRALVAPAGPPASAESAI